MNQTIQYDKNDNPKRKLVLGIIFISVGIIMAFHSISYSNSYNQKSESFILIKAQIIDYKNKSDDRYGLIVEYFVDGKVYKLTGSENIYYPKKIGTYVDIKYNSKNPNDSIFVEDNNIIFNPISSVVFFALGIFLLYDRNKIIKEQKNDNLSTPNLNNFN